MRRRVFIPLLCSRVAGQIRNPIGAGATHRIATNGLIGEYRFDERSGSTLTDRSGSGNHGYLGLSGSNLPTWTSQGLSFNGNALVQMPAAMNESIVSVQYFLNIATYANNVQALLAPDSGAWPFLRKGDSLAGVWSSSVNPLSATAQRVLGPVSITFVYGTVSRVYINGIETEAYLEQSPSTSSAATALWLGRFPFSGLGFRSLMYYMLVYNRPIGPSEVSTNHAVVARVLTGRGIKLGNILPDFQQVLFDGDSLTAGQNSVNNGDYPQQTMAQLAGSYNYTNLGIGGQSMVQMFRTQSAKVFPLLPGDTHTPIVFVWGGSNDLNLPSAGVNAAYIALTSYCRAARAAGCKVVVLTILPRVSLGNPNGFETDRQLYNSLIRSNYSSWADALADVGNDAAIGHAGQNTNTTYYSTDHTHLTNAGYSIVANYGRAALNSIGFN